MTKVISGDTIGMLRKIAMNFTRKRERFYKKPREILSKITEFIWRLRNSNENYEVLCRNNEVPWEHYETLYGVLYEKLRVLYKNYEILYGDYEVL